MQVFFVFECAVCDRQVREVREDVRVTQPAIVKIPLGWYVKTEAGKETYYCPACLMPSGKEKS